MLIRLVALVFFCFSLLPGCANTKQAEQADSKSILRKADSGQEIHGEVGVIYGASAR